ncbi:MAG TPA: hypothetical protein VGC79_17350, partial [Polyangiaceae bacterium]
MNQAGGTNQTGGTSQAGGGHQAGASSIAGAFGFEACAVLPSSAGGSPQASPADLVVNWNEIHQTMVGFGGSDKYHAALTDAQMDLLFSVDKGIGLSILRVAIDTNGNYIGQYSNATKAAARGAAVWATPWSPPGAWKDSGT